jgi:alpha-1,2-mannosyltransferase
VPEARLTAAPRWWVATVVVLASVVTAVVLHVRHPDALVTLLPSTDMRELHVDFDTFWHSAVALVHGADIYDTPAKLTNLNPPLLTVLITPFTGLDALTAYRIFATLTLIMVVGAVLAVAAELRLRRGVTAAVLVTVLASSPLHGTLVLGQIYPVLLVGLVGGWIAQRRGRPLLAAVLFGITVALKPSLAPLLLLPAVLRHWGPLRAGLAAATGATLLGVLVAGPSSGVEWLKIAFSEPVPDTVDNASLPGLAVRFGIPAVFGMLAGVAVLAGTLTWIGRNRNRVDPAGTVPFAVLAAGLLCSPISWHNYLMLLWPGILMLIPLGRGAAATMALAVTVVPVSWNADWPPEGLVADLGRSLYCVILLGYWLVLLSSAPRPVVVADPVAPVDRAAGGAAGGVVHTSGPVGSSAGSAGSAVTGADGASSMS